MRAWTAWPKRRIRQARARLEQMMLHLSDHAVAARGLGLIKKLVGARESLCQGLFGSQLGDADRDGDPLDGRALQLLDGTPQALAECSSAVHVNVQHGQKFISARPSRAVKTGILGRVEERGQPDNWPCGHDTSTGLQDGVIAGDRCGMRTTVPCKRGRWDPRR
jgi:hypothetical protein